MDQPWVSRFSGLSCGREYLERNHEGSVIISLNFGWIIDNELAGSRGPRSRQDLMSLKNHGIGALVRLVESDEALVTTNDVNDAGLEDYNEPVRDFMAPTQEQIDKIITYIDSHLERGIPVGSLAMRVSAEPA